MYEDFYNLSSKPFQLSPDARFFFNSQGHNRAMAYLRYGLEQSEGFIVITGGIGTGKTMLVRNLFDELDSTRVVAAELVTTQVEPQDMLSIVCASFGLTHKSSSKAGMLNTLESFLQARYAEGKRVLLVVDEAHNLPPKSVEELRMLSNFHADGQALLQSFLLGQEGLKDLLQSPELEQFRQRIIASYHLQALNRQETESYILHRLKLVGWRDNPQLADGVFDRIFNFTKGVPRRINTLSDRLLLFGCLEELTAINEKAVDKVIAEVSEEGWSFEKHRHRQRKPEPPVESDYDEDYPKRARPKNSPKSRRSASEDSELMHRLTVLEAEIESLKADLEAERRRVKTIQLRMKANGNG